MPSRMGRYRFRYERHQTGRATLQPADLTYLGMFLCPQDDSVTAMTRFGYSFGAIACRRVGGSLQVFITGAPLTAGSPGGDYLHRGDAIYEISYPGVGSSVATAPRASLVRCWGDIYGTNIGVDNGKRLLQQFPNQSPLVHGLMWDGTNNRLWWAYGSQYYTLSNPDPSIGCSILNDGTGANTPYGPWITQEHSQRTRGYMAWVPSDFATSYTSNKQLAVGGPVYAQNDFGPRGSVLYALDNFDPTTKTANAAGDTTYSVGCQRLIHHDSTNPQERSADYTVCTWNVNYDCAQGHTVQAGTADFNNNTYAYDTVSAATWVETSSRQGMVYFGQITGVVSGVTYANDTVPHLFYADTTTCCDGQVAHYGGGTGPHSASQKPMMWIYDPAKIALAATGSVNPWGFAASSATDLSSIASGVANIVHDDYQFGGACFDATGGLLLVSEIQREVIGEPRPVIHVFQAPL